MFKLDNIHTKLLTATIFSAGLALMPVASHAQMDNTYQWATFEEIDVDNSGYMEDGEYRAHAFGQADWDNDGYLEDTEWAKYTEVYYDEWGLDYDSYTYYDTDGDGFIDRSEFNESPSIALYEAWDNDEDGRINDDDWDRVTTYYYDNE